ncbi:hypothetical protein [Nodosilinea sp. E11]|uniref:hypothetical protein n=1 Tax=Nodosilinea sp. E11 TaxID=3037479 RepID=UPI0029350F86|nr:hypothetical protein [Nodosilinea sp. E11]WOD37249.1 hypothetical protein RRF56_01970 [Nodosilinea sp. E11]
MNQYSSRYIAKQAIEQSIPKSTWEKNERFTQHLLSQLKKHPISSHSVIEALNSSRFKKEELKLIHLDYRHAIVQIFTDALLAAQFQCRQLEPKLKPGSKMFPRFLLSLNVLDEFGFAVGSMDELYLGSPYNAHYPLFEELLCELGIGLNECETYVPSSISKQLREYLENSYSDLVSVVSLLAIAEEIVILFSAPLRESIKPLGIQVNSGYYSCHGSSSDSQAKAADDVHASDLWCIATQSLECEKYKDIEYMCQKYCDLWMDFWNFQMNRVM